METAEAKAFFETCPECGGQVHRVASRCKHCGADRAAPPEPEPEPEPPPTPQPTPPPVLSPSPSPPPQPTPRSRRWMLAGVGVLILAIGMALGILIERGSHTDRPHAVAPMVNVAAPDPDRDPAPDPDPDPGITFNWSFRSGPPARRPAPSSADLTVDQFVSRLGNELCTKITDCANADPAVGILCRTIAANIKTDDVADKIAAGECDYNAAAATACVDGLERLDCSTAGSAQDPLQDPFAMMMTVDSIMSCLDALQCSAW